jgi:asparagine synthase (glutamine-hydrolysing)
MCGIAAMIVPGGSADADALRRMSAAIAHRGPDGAGLHIDGSVGLAFRRLAILDLSSAADQPMFSADGEFALIFNGEIFNYVELRSELERLGHRFRSTGDSEVLLAAYQQWGADCLPKLNGMWAFLIYDRRARKVFGSRDRFGVKPLYTCRAHGAILFASEIKAIRASGYYHSEPNWRRASEFLLYSYQHETDAINTAHGSFYEDIELVPAGSAFEVTVTGRTTGWRFWSLEDAISAPPGDPVRAFAETFDDAVRLRMRSDVPVGVSLSGGLDSSSILCTMAALVAEPSSPPPRFHAFSYVSSEFDERPYITDTVNHTGAEWHVAKIDWTDPWGALSRVLQYQDEPFNSMNVLISFEIARQAASHGIKVLLNGAGSDETIGGYLANFINYWLSLVDAGENNKARSEIDAHCAIHGGNPVELYRTASTLRYRSQLRQLPGYRFLSSWRNRRRLQTAPWFTADIIDQLPAAYRNVSGLTLEATLKDQVERAPLPYYLRVDDRTFMAHSVEVRAPFLDYRLVALAFSLPLDWRMRGPWNKYVLRQAMKGRLPESVRGRTDKMGFPIPVRDWVKGPLYEPLQDILSSAETRARGIYNIDVIRRDLERHRAGELDASAGLLGVAQFEIWMRDVQGSTARIEKSA